MTRGRFGTGADGKASGMWRRRGGSAGGAWDRAGVGGNGQGSKAGKRHRLAPTYEKGLGWVGGKKKGCLADGGIFARPVASFQSACGRISWGGDEGLGGNRPGYGRPNPWETGQKVRWGWGESRESWRGVARRGPAVRNGAREVHGPPISNHSDRSSIFSGLWDWRSFGPEMQRTFCRCFMALSGVSVLSAAHMIMHATLPERWTPCTQNTSVLRVLARCTNSSKA